MMASQSASLDLATTNGTAARIRPLYWSVKRELWENRFVWIVPVAVAVIVLVAGLLTTMIALARASGSDPASTPQSIAAMLDVSPAPIMFFSLIVGIFYALDALYAERRDRSILFWKSLPLSDGTAVLAKILIPVVVVPAIGLALSILTQVLLLVAVLTLAAPSGLSVLTVWREAQFFEGLPIMTYGLSAHALWYAPIYAWALLISAWARRAPAMWFIVPPLLLIAMERMITGTSRVGAFIAYRFQGAMVAAFDDTPASRQGHIDALAQLEPLQFLTTPGLWLGLVFAAAATFAAIQWRRRREPH